MALILQEYEFDVIQRPGITHQNVDAISRNPSPSTEDHTDARQDFDLEPKLASSACLALSAGSKRALVPTLDIWKDEVMLLYLQGKGFPDGCTLAERDRIQHRARRYKWRGQNLVRIFPTEGERIVPPIRERPTLIQQIHVELGTLG